MLIYKTNIGKKKKINIENTTSIIVLLITCYFMEVICYKFICFIFNLRGLVYIVGSTLMCGTYDKNNPSKLWMKNNEKTIIVN